MTMAIKARKLDHDALSGRIMTISIVSWTMLICGVAAIITRLF